ncbi:Na(+)/iodide (NIS) cotransporter subfamily [Haloferula helveola]|uniref:Na(+)/iodide (NIS) cotransporter subfamily n=1 Tax=Haloferula helveola TaxID=490095 RepID=A0ABN6GXZ2_9BACT|nr:Na(+)/iodide (NIS) cotransporter subfamily [Haloferula helveola]
MIRILTAILLLVHLPTARASLDWTDLPALPDPTGFAGAFAGVSADALIVGGGANFPDAAPWDGGSKVWHDRVFVLTKTDGAWTEAGRLPRPLAYGVSVTTGAGLVCIGGSDADRHYADVFRLTWGGSKIVTETLPPLPVPLANMAGALVNGAVHIIGGTDSPDATTASNRHFAFAGDQWTELAPLPTDGRILPVAATRDGSFFVFSGASLAPDSDGKPVRTYLRDAWKYDASGNWVQLADIPRAAVAAPSPAPAIGASHLVVIGGDDGSLADFQPKSEHPGFLHEILAYDTITDTWTPTVELPSAVRPPVTAPVTEWNGNFVIASGEVRPAVRSPQVIALKPQANKSAFGAINWSIVGIYLAGMIGIGVFFMKREAAGSTEAYFRGGQRIPSWVAGLSIFATMLSALTFMGIPARAYRTDISWYLGQLPILLIVPLVAACYLPFFRKLDLTSAYEYLERRFSLACRVFASLSFTAFHLGRIAIVLYLPALALAAVSDINVTTAIIVIGVLCLIYTVIGGIEAVVWTDAIQALVLMAGALLCFGLAAFRVDGGPAGLFEIASQDHKLFENLRWDSFDIADGTTSVVILFIAFFFNSFVPYTSSQDVVQRYVTTPDLPAARKSLKVTMWMSVFGSLVFFLLGTAIYAFYKTHPARLDPTLTAGDSILPFYIVRELPVGISGLVIAAIFAAAQSTVSSSLNSVATAFVKDFDSRLFRPGRSDHSYLRSAQAAVIIAGVIGIGIAVTMAQANIESAFKTFNSMVGLTAGSLGGLFALGVFTRRSHGTGAIIGAVTGLVTVLILHLTGAPVTGLLYAFIGFSSCFLVGWIASLVLPGHGDSTLSLRNPS